MQELKNSRRMASLDIPEIFHFLFSSIAIVQGKTKAINYLKQDSLDLRDVQD